MDNPHNIPQIESLNIEGFAIGIFVLFVIIVAIVSFFSMVILPFKRQYFPKKRRKK